MSLTVVERRIPDLAVEDSYALSEIVARVRDEYPELPPLAAKAHIRTVVHSLFPVVCTSRTGSGPGWGRPGWQGAIVKQIHPAPALSPSCLF